MMTTGTGNEFKKKQQQLLQNWNSQKKKKI